MVPSGQNLGVSRGVRKLRGSTRSFVIWRDVSGEFIVRSLTGMDAK